jgi:hypothetical protein
MIVRKRAWTTRLASARTGPETRRVILTQRLEIPRFWTTLNGKFSLITFDRVRSGNGRELW